MINYDVYYNLGIASCLQDRQLWRKPIWSVETPRSQGLWGCAHKIQCSCSYFSSPPLPSLVELITKRNSSVKFDDRVTHKRTPWKCHHYTKYSSSLSFFLLDQNIIIFNNIMWLVFTFYILKLITRVLDSSVLILTVSNFLPLGR